MKKKYLIAAAALLVLLFFAGNFIYNSYYSKGITKNCITETNHKSATFTNEEINSAIKAVKDKFVDFGGCDLKEIRYDENIRSREADMYMLNGRGAKKNIEKSNVMILVSTFETKNCDAAAKGGFNCPATYTGWLWILVRDSQDGEWVVDDWGY